MVNNRPVLFFQMSGSLLLAARACARSVAEAVAQPARLRVSSARCGCSRRFYVQPTTTTTPATAHTQNPVHLVLAFLCDTPTTQKLEWVQISTLFF